MLLLTDHADIDSVVPNNTFTTYMRKHHSDWVKQAKMRGLDIKELGIILVRGTVQTTSWTVAAFQNNEKGQSIDISGTFLSAGQAGFTLAGNSKSTSSVEYRSGPTAPEGRTPSPAPSPLSLSSTANQLAAIGDSTLSLAHTRSRSVESHASTKNTQYNQCVFLPHYKIKFRLVPFHLFPRKIEAAAGPHHLPDPDQDDEMAPAVPVVVADDDDGSVDDADPEAADVSTANHSKPSS